MGQTKLWLLTLDANNIQCGGSMPPMILLVIVSEPLECGVYLMFLINAKFLVYMYVKH